MLGIYLGLLLSAILASPIYADMETHGGDHVDLQALGEEPLFVSLGSYCIPSGMLRSCGLRKAAFPLDWNISMNGEKLIEMLQDGFSHFLDNQYLVPFGWATLLNTYYELEFVHDGSWDGDNPSTYMPILQDKYKRRIERFLQLKDYPGKVYFLRAAYIYSLEDLNRYYKNKENIEISEDSAFRLFNTLKSVFENLDFTLIIINNHEYSYISEEKKLNDRLLMVRAPAFDVPVMTSAYQAFFDRLLQSL